MAVVKSLEVGNTPVIGTDAKIDWSKIKNVPSFATDMDLRDLTAQVVPTASNKVFRVKVNGVDVYMTGSTALCSCACTCTCTCTCNCNWSKCNCC